MFEQTLKWIASIDPNLLTIILGVIVGAVFTLGQVYLPMFHAKRALAEMKKRHAFQTQFFEVEEIRRNMRSHVEPNISFTTDPSNFDEPNTHKTQGKAAFKVVDEFLTDLTQT